jgi:SNF2 family DNA or RNA helicase
LIIAEVKVAESQDKIVIVPRDPEQKHLLSKAIKDQLPGISISSRAEGLTILAKEAPRLIAGNLTEVDLRWSPEASRFVVNRKRVAESRREIATDTVHLLEMGEPAARERLGDIVGLDVLDGHQWVNVAAMTLKKGFGLCVFDEQGAGKTVTLIHAFDVLACRDLADFLLIVAPKSMVPEWPRDFERFKGDLYKVSTLSGSKKDKVATLTKESDVIVTNFETAIALEDELRSALQRHGDRAVLVVDESFLIKNLDATRTRALRRLREWCGRAFVLCGTPAPNEPKDIVSQFNLVDFGITFDAVTIPDDRTLAKEVVRGAIEKSGLYVRHLKREVFPDLPLKRFQRVMVPLQPIQAELYKAALRELSENLKAIDDSAFKRQLTSFMARKTALLQICSNPTGLVNGYNEIPAKLTALDQLLDDLVGRKREKVVLWSFYTKSLDGIMARYKKFNPVRYDGQVSDVNDRSKAVRRFQEDDTTMLFVANPAAAGAGLTLHRARYAIYESMSNQAAHYLQSLDRIHRRGQSRDVEYLILLGAGTIEVREYERLLSKEDMARDMLGDTGGNIETREAMLSDTLEALQLFETSNNYVL